MDYLVKSLAELGVDGVAALRADMQHKKIQDYSIEELRAVIHAQVGLEYLVPVALLNLIPHPFAKGDLYAGDLLVSVLEVREEFWEVHPMYVASVQRLCKMVKVQVNEMGISSDVKAHIMALVSQWE